MEKETEAIVESLLNEGDVRSLTMSMDAFEDTFDGSDLHSVWESLQSVQQEIWGHLAPEVVNKLRSSLDSTRVNLANFMRVGKEALQKARSYKPQRDYQDYDSAAHSGELSQMHGHETPDRSF